MSSIKHRVNGAAFDKLVTFLNKYQLPNKSDMKGMSREEIEKIPKRTHYSFGPPWGSYHIPKNKEAKFLKLYTKAVLAKLALHMIEAPIEVTPLPIDIDLKFEAKYSERQYTMDDIQTVIQLYNKYLKKYFEVRKKDLKAFVFEKKKPTFDQKKQHYRDGWHIVYPNVPMNTACKLFLSHLVKEEIKQKDMFGHLHFFNDLNEVFDVSIAQGSGWCLYGSRKHDGHVYQLTEIFNSKMSKVSIKDYSKEDLIQILSMHRYDPEDLVEFNSEYDPDEIEEEIERVVSLYTKKKNKSTPSKTQRRWNQLDNAEDSDSAEYEMMDFSDDEDGFAKMPKKVHRVDTRQERLQKERKKVQKKETRTVNRLVAQAMQLVNIMSVERATDYASWIRVGWALCNVHEKDLFDTWIRFSQKSPGKFDYAYCEQVWEDAKRRKGVGYGMASLRLWARQDDSNGFMDILRENMSGLYDQALSGTPHDVAKVVAEMYRDSYVCVDPKKQIWYHFTGHRWEQDGGRSLMLCLAEDLSKKFMEHSLNYHHKACASTGARDRDEAFKNMKTVNKIVEKLKNTGYNGQVLDFAGSLMYNKNFMEKLNSHPNLIGFENGVYDLEAREFRDGCPEDCISMSTQINYREFTEDCEEVQTIERFFHQVMVDQDMFEYLLTLLATYIDGTTRMQQLVIWTGGGGNGKSTVTTFFENTFGDYCGTLPINLLTKGRTAAGAATAELASMAGKRFGIFQEPEQDDKINVGYMKELTGGDRMLIRGLYQEAVNVRPQFKLLLTCNVLPAIPSTDEGTWRRLRVTPFESQFVDEDFEIENKRQFRKDRDLVDKLKDCSEAFAWYLINVWYPVYRKKGLKEPDKVKMYTNKWREDSDQYKAFLNEHLEITGRSRDREDFALVYSEFKSWYYQTYAEKNKCPNKRKVEEYLQKNNYKIERGMIIGVTFKTSGMDEAAFDEE